MTGTISESTCVEVDTDQTADYSIQCDMLQENNSESNECNKSSNFVESTRTNKVEKLNESLVSLGETQIKSEKIL